MWHFTFVYLSHYGAAGHGLDYSTIALLVSIEKFGYGFGFIGNMVYMMQQIAPGRSTMTHYAFAGALMNFMLVPTTMVSGPLAEWLGFSTFFVVVMFASIPSVWAAFKAPFPRATDPMPSENETAEAPALTADDPSLLTPVERTVQALAGRSSIFAMLNILTLLTIDAKILGSLQGQTAGSGQTQFFLLLGVCGVKFFFSWKTFSLAAAASQAAATEGEKNYLSNARGAKIATWVCAAVSLAVLAFGARMAF